MIKDKKIVAFLPAKGSSERIESKNLKLLDGKPLFLHTLKKLVECDFIDEVYLDSDSDEILDYASSYLKYIPLKREPYLATNKTDGHQVFCNEVRQADADIYIQILGTSPFIKKETIRRGVQILIEQPEYDSAVLMRREKEYVWKEGAPTYDRDHVPNSKDLPDTWIESMGLYIVRSDIAHCLKRRFGDRVYMLEASPMEAVDVNYPEDFEFADVVEKGRHSKEVRHFRLLSRYLNTSIFSDILWEYGLCNVYSGLKLNLPEQKIMGRANTLKVRRLDIGEDHTGIYDGLKSYDYIRNGDIIVVENECPEFAYFGEINCNLAIRSGAIAAIIDGVTRDIREVTHLSYPVFSRGYSCMDVRGHATVESQNQKISIGGVNVCPGDLIFADVNGVVVIPKRIEREVLIKAIKAAATEKSVLARIANKEEAYLIYKKEGAF